MSGLFLPSMIEVEFGEYYRSCAELLFKNGFKSFHIDFGDKKLIGRELECWDKVFSPKPRSRCETYSAYYEYVRDILLALKT